MASVHALDDYYLAITLLVTIGYQLVFFAIAWTFKFDKVTGAVLVSSRLVFRVLYTRFTN